MNFLLTTCLLSQKTDSRDRITGGMIGENVKPKGIEKFNEEIQDGILFTHQFKKYKMSNPAYLKSLKRLNPKFSKYGDHIIDVFYDHLAALNWQKISPDQDLGEYIDKLYQLMIDYHPVIPYKMNRLIPFLISKDLLRTLNTVDGLHKYVKFIAKKDTFQGSFEYAIIDLIENYSAFKEDFEEFVAGVGEFMEEVEAKHLAS
ncbi:MAG: ACP phosphodiesterase [Cytophagaceae bacterium]